MKYDTSINQRNAFSLFQIYNEEIVPRNGNKFPIVFHPTASSSFVSYPSVRSPLLNNNNNLKLVFC